MPNVDDLFRKPNARPNGQGVKRKFEYSDAQQVYKSAKVSDENDADEDVEAGPELPGDDDVDGEDEDGRFYGGGITRDTTSALDYLDTTEEENIKEEKIDAVWARKLVTNLERKINKNSEHRARYEGDPQKFMSSEAELDAEIKGLSILSEHPELYGDFTEADGASHLVSLLAHENTDIAINAMEIIAELIDDDVETEQDQWDVFVNGMLDSDLIGLLASDLDRFDEEANESDRQGVYHTLAVLEGLASRNDVAGKISTEPILKYLLRRVKVKESVVSQNKQYAAEILQVLLQSVSQARVRVVKLEGVDTLLRLLASYRKRDPPKDSHEEEYAENLFDALACLTDDPQAKTSFVENEGMELMLLMLKEGKFSKSRAVRVIDHVLSDSPVACDRLVEAAGLKALFSVFMKTTDSAMRESLVGCFSSLLKLLAGNSNARIRLLGKFVEKDYEKTRKLDAIRKEYQGKVAEVDENFRHDTVFGRRDAAKASPKLVNGHQQKLSKDLGGDDDDEWIQGLDEEQVSEWLSQRMDAGLYLLQSTSIVLAWILAEDEGARTAVSSDGSLQLSVKRSLQAQMSDAEKGDDSGTGEMLGSLIEYL